MPTPTAEATVLWTGTGSGYYPSQNCSNGVFIESQITKGSGSANHLGVGVDIGNRGDSGWASIGTSDWGYWAPYGPYAPSGSALTLGQVATLRIEFRPDGNAYLFRNGVFVSSLASTMYALGAGMNLSFSTAVDAEATATVFTTKRGGLLAVYTPPPAPTAFWTAMVATNEVV
jgi:hypothetical protein